MNRYQITIFKTASGKSPVDEFIDAQDLDTQAKITRGFELLKTYGPATGQPYVKYLGDRLYELRIRGRGESRFFFTITAQQIIRILHAFAKRSQKIPDKELKTARRRLKQLD